MDRELRSEGAEGRAAVAELHALLLKAARFEVGRRAAGLAHLRGGDQEDLAQQAADDALMAVLAKLDDFRGESRFTTWAYKFALLLSDGGASAGRGAEDAELFAALRERGLRVGTGGEES